MNVCMSDPFQRINQEGFPIKHSQISSFVFLNIFHEENSVIFQKYFHLGIKQTTTSITRIKEVVANTHCLTRTISMVDIQALNIWFILQRIDKWPKKISLL